MRLVRVGPAGRELPAALHPDNDHVAFDLRPLTAEIDGAFLSSPAFHHAAVAVQKGSLPRVDLEGLRLGPPIARPGAIYAIGLNYRDHAAESGMEVPTEPIVFTKASNTLSGPTDPIVIPRGACKLDWEAELGVIVGRRSQYLDLADAARSIAGYVAVNDLSERAWQLERGGQWSKGKSFSGANPAGPVLATRESLGDLNALAISLQLNGAVMQAGNTANMVFTPEYLVWYLSQFVVLEPGDLIDTGTPAGVGMGHSPPQWLQPGDVLELQITGLGAHRNEVRAWEPES